MSYGISVYCCDLERFSQMLRVERIAETEAWLKREGMRGPTGLSVTGDNDPGVGMWSADRVAFAHRHFEEHGFPETSDADVEGVLTDISDWLEIAALRREAVVGYYY